MTFASPRLCALLYSGLLWAFARGYRWELFAFAYAVRMLEESSVVLTISMNSFVHMLPADNNYASYLQSNHVPICMHGWCQHCDTSVLHADGPTGMGAEAVDADTESFAAALEDLHRLSAEVLKQAEEDRRLFGM